ncbi:alpha-methylacyl-CoA racemase [Entomortierella parvispora]|uniref:Alpha-methylacyl-CoA racemase n=1 Tax=Entomortierella parvispora TaxID=205924 RepID=A0A9P3H0H5_9FUNG|nr:alpha-methylacyl-CoA racemase [Entomortierella parvispora]
MTTPLAGLKVIEIAGLAPAPFAGKILADFGADVIRVDRSTAVMNLDVLAANKRSIALNLKSPQGIETLIRLCEKADVVIEPFRPGVMERLGLGPDVLLKRNPRLVYARMTGFGQQGHYAKMAGHDINYLAISGVLNTLGKHDDKPAFPINLLADFAGGGLMCALGVLLALQERTKSGKGQVVDAAMIDGVNYIGSFVYNMNKAGALFQTPRGTGQLDGGAPFYDCYKTKDGLWMAVGAIEVEFYQLLLKGLGLDETKDQLPEQMDAASWPKMKALFTKLFSEKSQEEWVKVFDQTDACVTPVLDYYSMPTPAPAPKLLRTPGLAVPQKEENADVFLEVGGQSAAILKEAGLSEQEIRELVVKRVVSGAGLEKASL